MASMKIPILWVTLSLLAAGCGRMITSDAPENLVVAEVHFQKGFERHWVSVELDGDVHFEGYLDRRSQTEPLATFYLDIPHDSHQIVVRWVPTDGNQAAQLSTLDIPPSPRESCYLGLTVLGNSILIRVQEDPFRYV
ncbi:MAG: hypothetical protein JSW54_13425 [Fidelibacterota bacterium]|nr:MAG: hypothetical protein JSW54_13425 [Candidatus Neomarinimicrobiota bacterium]